MKKLMLVFSAGCLGALANSLAVWLMGQYGITTHFGVAIHPSLSPQWLYPRIVWGGLWGFLFLLPMLQSRPLLKGTLLSLFPTVAFLLVVLPFKEYKGFLGLELGLLTPLFVLFFNWIWGVVTSFTLRFAK